MSSVISKFWSSEEAVEYYNCVRNTPNSVIILSRDEYESVAKAKELIFASPFAYSYFTQAKTYEELRHQVPIYFTYKGHDFKALLDGIKIDHKHNIIQPFDLKTTSKDVYKFHESYLRYGYYRQAALYEQALLSKESPIKNLLAEGYELKDFIFIVVETRLSSVNPAIIYRTSKTERKAGLKGGKVNGEVFKGIDQLLEDYLWHQETDHWVYPREVFQNGGEISLNIF